MRSAPLLRSRSWCCRSRSGSRRQPRAPPASRPPPTRSSNARSRTSAWSGECAPSVTNEQPYRLLPSRCVRPSLRVKRDSDSGLELWALTAPRGGSVRGGPARPPGARRACDLARSFLRPFLGQGARHVRITDRPAGNFRRPEIYCGESEGGPRCQRWFRWGYEFVCAVAELTKNRHRTPRGLPELGLGNGCPFARAARLPPMPRGSIRHPASPPRRGAR